jgi:hypothetical protein
MDIDKKIDEKFKYLEDIDFKIKEKRTTKDINRSSSFKAIQSKRSRNNSSLIQNKDTMFESLYNFKTYFSQEKCCHPLREWLNRYTAKKCSIYDLKSFSNNKASFTTKESDVMLTQSKSKIKPALINLKRTFPYKIQFENRTISDTNKKNKGESLYFKGIGMKLKLEGKIEKSFSNYNKENVPNINPNSKKMIERDSSACFERLYPRHLVESYKGQSPINVIKNNHIEDIHDIERRIYRKSDQKIGETFSFKPYISDRSKSLALKKGSVVDRILAVKKRRRSVEPNIGEVNYFLCNKTSSFSFNRNNEEKKVSKFTMNHLYEEAEILKKKRDDKINQVKQVEENSLKLTHTFRPDISKPNNQLFKKDKKHHNKESLYKRQERWKKNLSTRNEKIKEYFVNLEMEDCTFKPNIKSNILPDDDEFIQKNLSQIMLYVNQRQNILDNHNNQKNYENKKFFNKSRNFIIKPTICKEFDFKTSKLNRSLNMNTSKYKLNNNDIRSKLNKENFFSVKRLKESGSTNAGSSNKSHDDRREK